MCRVAHEMRRRSSFVVNREIYYPKMIRCDLLTHEDAADLPLAS